MTLPVLTPARVPLLSEMSRRTDKPICVIWQTEWLEGPGAGLYENDPRVALFRSSRRCFATLASWHNHEASLLGPQEATSRASPRQAAEKSGKILAECGLPVPASPAPGDDEEQLPERDRAPRSWLLWTIAAVGVVLFGERIVLI